MSKRFVPVLLAGVVFLAGLALAEEPPAGADEPPVRLKKKNKPNGDDKPTTDPGKKDDKKPDDKKKDQPKAGDSREAEPATPQENEKEVLQRVVKNAHAVEEKLAKSDLGEGTRQTQRDILKDIESLIQRSENPPQGGGGGGGEDKNPMDNKDQQGQQGGNTGQKQPGGQQSRGQKSGGQRPGGRRGTGKRPGGQKSGGQQPGGQKSGGQNPGGQRPGSSGQQPGGRNGNGGNGGAGGDKDNPSMNRNADLYKDIWGHLPETLRAQMDAFSNPEPFLPKYDELIKRYYRTIAEQGRRKGQ